MNFKFLISLGLIYFGLTLARAETLAPTKLECIPRALPRNDLSADCYMLKVYDRLAVENLDNHYRDRLARECACELFNMDWDEFSDDGGMMRNHERVSVLVDKYRLNNTYPEYLWSDVEIVVNGVSVLYSVHEYFERARRKNLPASMIKIELLQESGIWKDTMNSCGHIHGTGRRLYGYLENLQRLNPVTFFQLLHFDLVINATYQASKFCKLLVIEQLDSFKLRPDNRDFVPATFDLKLSTEEEMQYNQIQGTEEDDIDSVLKHASISLVNCERWQREQLSIDQLLDKCPMMAQKELPYEWVSNRTTYERTCSALFCSCQLLLHKSAWAELMLDPNVDLMSRALVAYLREIKFPKVEEIPIWAFQGWFDNSLQKFEENRKLMIRELIKIKHGSQDPIQAINGKSMDEVEALELLRRGCNLIMFGRNRRNRKTTEIKIIQYLDNLKFISLDPQFVFAFTLQDKNLFKLHALSKVCKPVVS